MFRKFAAVLASVVALAVSAGCATNGSTTPTAPTQAQITAFAAAAQVKVQAACTAFAPTLSSVAVLDPALTAVSTGVNLACAANSALNTTSVSNLINTSIPTAIADVNASSMGNKAAVAAGLMLLQSALSVALAEYNLSVATGTTVSLTSAVAPKVSVKLVTQ
jgi:hypothetical protein